jgi:DNA-binding response OmpR family regulator
MKSEQNGERVLRLTRTDIELLTILSSQEIIPDSHLYAHLQINRSRLKDKKCLERHIENLRIKLRGFAIISRVQGYGYALLAIEETSDAVSA